MKMFKHFLEESDKLAQILVDWVSEHIGGNYGSFRFLVSRGV